MKYFIMCFILFMGTFSLINDVYAVCCFPYDNDGYIDPTTGFYNGVSEVQNDSYFGLSFGNVAYHFQFFDENNNVILEKTETITDDLPITSGFVIPPGLTIPFKVTVNDVELSKKIKSFQFAGTENLEYYSWKPADLKISFDKIEVEKSDNSFSTWKIQGTILNDHTQSTKNVYVLASIYQKDSHIIGVAGYSTDDIQPLTLNKFESKNFTLYSTIPSNLIPDHVNLYAESDESSMMHQHYKPIILKDATNYEGKTTSDPKKPITISANVTNISRKNLDFDWIIQIKKSPKSVSEGDLTKYPESKVEFIKKIPSHVDAQKNTKLEYSWIPQSNGIYFYEMYVWDDSEALSYPFIWDFLSDNWIFVSSNMNSVTNQIKSGIHPEDIKCKETLTIVTKYDGSPVCVKPETKIKLIERKWTSDTVNKLLNYSNEFLSKKSKRINQTDFTNSIPLTLFSVTPQNVTLPDSTKKTPTDTIIISISKTNQVKITNSDSTKGQKTHLAQLSINGATLYTKDIENLPAKPGFDTLVFDYTIQSKDNEAFYAMFDFEIQFGSKKYPTLLNGGEFSEILHPDEKRSSSFSIQVDKAANQITLNIKDSITKNTLWVIPLELATYKTKCKECHGNLIGE